MSRSRHLLWFSGLAALLWLVFISLQTAALSPPLLALQLAPTPEAFGRVLDRWQAPGIALYRAHFVPDFMLLACYGLFGALFARQVLRGGRARRAAAAAALPAAALCDAAENLLHLQLLSAPAALDAALVAAAFGASVLKWLLILAFTVLVATGWRRR